MKPRGRPPHSQLEREALRELLIESHDALHELLEHCGAWRLRTKLWEAAHYQLRTAIRTGRATYEEHEELFALERAEWLKTLAQKRQALVKIKAMRGFLKEIARRNAIDPKLRDRARSYLEEFFPNLNQADEHERENRSSLPHME